jgi:hypothetical protein
MQIKTEIIKNNDYKNFSVLYQTQFLGKKFLQNCLMWLSAFCQNAVFGNMSVTYLSDPGPKILMLQMLLLT